MPSCGSGTTAPCSKGACPEILTVKNNLELQSLILCMTNGIVNSGGIGQRLHCISAQATCQRITALLQGEYLRVQIVQIVQVMLISAEIA